MSNKETLQSYNTRLNTNNISLDSILESINKLPENKEPLLQDKKVTITSNGIKNIVADEDYAGLRIVEVETDVKSTVEDMKNIEDMQRVINSKIGDVIAYFRNYPDTYETYTNEPVTLYTPSVDCKYYTIRCRGLNSYSILWIPPTFINYYSVALFHTALLTISKRTHLLDGNLYNSEGSISLGTYNIVGYYSSNYSSIEECIEAMKSPNTTYTEAPSSYKWSFEDPRQYGWSDYAFPCTNLPCFENNILLQSKKVSSDETIEVM